MIIFDAQEISRRLYKLINNSPEIQNILSQIVQFAPEPKRPFGEFDLPTSISYFPNSAKEIKLPEFLQPFQLEILRNMLRLRTLLFTKLLHTPEDQKRTKKYMKQIIERDKECQEKMNRLIAKLDSIMIRNNEEVRRTAYRVGQLKTEMENLNKYLSERIRRTKTNEDQNVQQIKHKHEGETKTLTGKISKMIKTTGNLIEQNQTDEYAMRRKIFKVESELDSIISKYDQEMTQLQDEYDELDNEYTEEKKALTELEERFETLNEEYENIMEERRLAEEARQREEENQRSMEQAVTTIQAFWRSYKTRKMARGGARKAKKK